jgi:lysophospholipase L1-like esterase
MRERKIEFLILFIVPILLFLLLEVSVRLIDLESYFYNIKLDLPQWMAEDPNLALRVKNDETFFTETTWQRNFITAEKFRVKLEPESILHFSLPSPYTVKSNSLGFRTVELNSRSANNTVKPVLLFGDSSTFGWGVPQGATWGDLIQEGLSEKIRVHNFGIPGDSSEYGKLVFDEFVSTFKEPIIFLSFGANDAKLTHVPHAKAVEKFRTRDQVLRKVIDYLKVSAIFRIMELAWRNYITESLIDLHLTKTHAVPLSRYRDNLTSMVTKSKSLGGKVIIISLCSPKSYRRMAKKVATKEKVFYINGEKELLSEPFSSDDACHPNVKGSILIARKVEDKLKTLLQ